MANIDIFNGDADGICALIQLRLAEPKESRLVTGVKRDISLVEKAGISAGDEVTALDISFDKNRAGVVAAIEQGASIFYVDHHFAGDIPDSARLTTKINPDANVCTSLLINGHLQGQYLAWAVTGAFGDNLFASAEAAAKPLGLSNDELESLKSLGTYLNYNGYGSSLEDLHFHPAELYQGCVKFSSPFDYMQDVNSSFAELEAGYKADMASAEALEPMTANDVAAVFSLPNERWARRVSGVYGNALANDFPNRAHGVLTLKDNGNYLVSVRAPLNNKTGADEICRAFPTGGGRAAAAGINDLPADQVDAFIDMLNQFYA